MKINIFIVAFLVILTSILMYTYLGNEPLSREAANEIQFKKYCSSCHITPSIQNIPKHIWRDQVLPEMGARMGNVDNKRNRSQGSLEENFHVKNSNTYPVTPMMDSIEWCQLRDYIIDLAPDTVYNYPSRQGRNHELQQFVTFFDSLNLNKPTRSVVNIKFSSLTNQLFISDVYGQIYDYNDTSKWNRKFYSPVISSVIDDSMLYLTEIGRMSPSEIPSGKIHRLESGSSEVLYEKLHRPVFTEVCDLNEDGKNEILICEFGYHSGALSMLLEKDSVLMKRTLLALPGSIKVEIEDMNGDGKKDVIALFSQGREGVYIFYQDNELQFDIAHVIKMGPEYGSSWFELVDYNKDGHLDIVLVNGDNADYSNFLKPYHGVRIFLNDGKNRFEEKWFYPINGSTRVLVEDFDMDGDIDFAVLSFFPDFTNCLEEGFVYLENKDSDNYLFESFVTQDAKDSNWMVMEKGDFDEDGDVDIMLGGFSLLAPKKIQTSSQRDLLYLKNTAIE
ncbi:MAG: VCBS repeat-containing protein [Reichenbachiella sp.]